MGDTLVAYIDFDNEEVSVEKERQRPKQLRTLLQKYDCKTVEELDEYIEYLETIKEKWDNYDEVR